MLEKEIEHQILTWLNYQPGIFAFKVQTAGFFDTKRKIFRKNLSKFIIQGTSDIIGMMRKSNGDAQFFCIEVKTPIAYKRFHRKPTDADLNQIAFIKKVHSLGGSALVADSLVRVKAWIREMELYNLFS